MTIFRCIIKSIPTALPVYWPTTQRDSILNLCQEWKMKQIMIAILLIFCYASDRSNVYMKSSTMYIGTVLFWLVGWWFGWFVCLLAF